MTVYGAIVTSAGSSVAFADGTTVNGQNTLKSPTMKISDADLGLTVSSPANDPWPAGTKILSLNWTAADGVSTTASKVFTSATAVFSDDDLNKPLILPGVYPVGTFIVSRNSGGTSTTSVTLSQNCLVAGATALTFTIVRGGQYCQMSANAASGGGSKSFTILGRNPVDDTGNFDSSVGIQTQGDAWVDGTTAVASSSTAKYKVNGTIVFPKRNNITIEGFPGGTGIPSNMAMTTTVAVADGQTLTGSPATGNLTSPANAAFTPEDITKICYGPNMLAAAFTDGNSDGSNIYTSGTAVFALTDVGLAIVATNASNVLNLIPFGAWIVKFISSTQVVLNTTVPAGSGANQTFVVGRNVITNVLGPQAATVTPNPTAAGASAFTIVNRMAAPGGALFFAISDGSTAVKPTSTFFPGSPAIYDAAFFTWPTRRAGFTVMEGTNVSHQNCQYKGFSGLAVFYDGVANSTTTFTSATAAFTVLDNGRQIHGAGIPYGTTCTFVSATQITLSAAATITGGGIMFSLVDRIPVGELGGNITSNAGPSLSGHYGIVYFGHKGGAAYNCKITRTWSEAIAYIPSDPGKNFVRPSRDCIVEDCYLGLTQRQGISVTGGVHIDILNNYIDHINSIIVDMEPAGQTWPVVDVNLMGNIFGPHGLACVVLTGAGMVNGIRITDNQSMTDLLMTLGGTNVATIHSDIFVTNNYGMAKAVSARQISLATVTGLWIAGNQFPMPAAYSGSSMAKNTATDVISTGNNVLTATAPVWAKSHEGSIITCTTTPGALLANTYITKLGPGLNQVTLSSPCSTSSGVGWKFQIHQSPVHIGDTTTLSPLPTPFSAGIHIDENDIFPY